MTKMLDIVLENEDWYTQLNHKLFEIKGTDSLGQKLKVSVLWRQEEKVGGVHIDLYLGDEFKIPGDICKTSMDMFLEALKPLVPQEEYSNIKLRIASLQVHYGDLEVNLWSYLPLQILNSISLPEPVSELIQPGYTDNLLISDDVLPTFPEGFKERADGLKRRIDKLYMGFKKGTFNGHPYVLPDRHHIVIRMDEGKHPRGSRVINPHMFGTILISPRDIRTTADMAELMSYVQERFKSFDVGIFY